MKARGNRRNSRGYIPHDDKRDIQPDKIAGVIMSNAVFNWALSPGPEDHWRTCKDTVYDIRPQIRRRNPEWCQDNRCLNGRSCSKHTGDMCRTQIGIRSQCQAVSLLEWGCESDKSRYNYFLIPNMAVMIEEVDKNHHGD